MSNPKCYLTAGGSGSGKTSGIDGLLSSGIIPGDVLVINCDKHITAGLSYHDATELARAEFEDALTAHRTMLIDGTLANEQKAVEQIKRLRSTGYRIIVHHFVCSIEAALIRNQKRTKPVANQIVVDTAQRSMSTVKRLMVDELIDEYFRHNT